MLSIEEEWMLKYSLRVPITLVGVWDTVGALGIPAFHISGISRSTFGFLHTGLRLPVRHGFHALAVNEYRAAFAPTLWTKRETATAPDRPLSSVEQRWFIGAHETVGGGYESDLLAQLPLRWMMAKASPLGLAFRSDVALDGEAVTAPYPDSFASFMHGFYRLARLGQRYYRPIDHSAAGDRRVGVRAVAARPAVPATKSRRVGAAAWNRHCQFDQARPGERSEHGGSRLSRAREFTG